LRRLPPLGGLAICGRRVGALFSDFVGDGQIAGRLVLADVNRCGSRAEGLLHDVQSVVYSGYVWIFSRIAISGSLPESRFLDLFVVELRKGFRMLRFFRFVWLIWAPDRISNKMPNEGILID
jgi:hypothetical protein